MQQQDTMDAPQYRQTLAGLLDSELSCANELLTTIKAETQAISTDITPELDLTLEQKKLQVGALQQATLARVRSMETHKFSAATVDVEACIKWCDQDDILRSRFDQLSELANQCYIENQLAGQLINRRAFSISRAIDALRSTPESMAGVYQKNGTAGSSSRSKVLGEA